MEEDMLLGYLGVILGVGCTTLAVFAAFALNNPVWFIVAIQSDILFGIIAAYGFIEKPRPFNKLFNTTRNDR